VITFRKWRWRGMPPVLIVVLAIAAIVAGFLLFDGKQWQATLSFNHCGVFARDNCVVDGDTFRFRGDKIRIADIDAPELSPPRCEREAELGNRAKHRLLELLNAGPFVLVARGQDVDQYGRKLRVVTRGGRSIGDTLVAEGLARTWTGRREPWC
jgi:endonuclease YncB( thermonuclease family)